MEDYDGGITLGLDPVAWHFGAIAVSWFGLLIALGLTAGVYLALREARRSGLDEDVVYSAALWTILGGILGGRLFNVVDKLEYYFQNPALLFSLRQSSMAMWGAILGGLLALVIYGRRRGLAASRLADVAIPGLVVGQIIGRVGSLINGESWGSPTSLPWGLIYTNPGAAMPPASQGIPTHPYPIYEILWLLVVLAVLWQLRSRILPDGALFAVYLLLYSVGRFALTYVRQEGYFLLGLQQAQVVAAGVFLVALPWLVYQFTGKPEALERERAK